MLHIISILIVLLASAFFSGLEIAFISSNKLRFEMERTEGGLSSRILGVFYQHPNNFISTILVGNNIALVIYGILMAELLGNTLFRAWHIGADMAWLQLILQTVLSTLIVLVTSEFLPKTLFRINPNKALSIFAIPAFICYITLYPVARFTALLSKGLLRLAGARITHDDNDTIFTKVDLDNFIQSSIDQNSPEDRTPDEIRIFQNALDFSSVKTRDCIVPRTEINAVDIHTTLETLKSKFIESGHSKLIVYEEHIDNIVGYIHSSELFHDTEDWTTKIRKLPIVPETMAAHKLLKIFLQQKRSVAVVVDEFGGTSGIVSMEDLMEEIFGDIEDEHDTTNYVAKCLAPNEYLLSARLEIEKANELFNLDLPESDEYLTIGGLILQRYQSFPKLNEEVKIDHFTFKIVKRATTKIELVRLKVEE